MGVASMMERDNPPSVSFLLVCGQESLWKSLHWLAQSVWLNPPHTSSRKFPGRQSYKVSIRSAAVTPSVVRDAERRIS